MAQFLRALDAQTMKIEIVSVVVALEELLRVLAGAPAHGYKMKRDDIHPIGINRREVIRET